MAPYLNMVDAFSRNQSPFYGSLQGREQIPGLRGHRYRRVEDELVGEGMRQVGELGDQRGHLQVDVVVPVY